MVEFILAVFFLLITPGPGVLSTAGVGAAYGYKSGLAYVGGLFVGNNLVSILVISGIATVVLAVPWLRLLLLTLSICYLLFLAWRIANAGSRVGFIKPEKRLGFWNGLGLQPINPKAYVVATTLFSGFGFLPQSLWLETIVKLVLLNVVWIPIHLIWLMAGVRLRSLNLEEKVQQRINICMALLMIAVVALALSAG